MQICLKKGVKEFLNEKFSFGEKNEFETYLDAYYLKKHHLDRLVHVAEKIIPFIKPGSRILDLGSDGIFPYIVKNFVEDIDAYAVSKWDHEIIFTEDSRAYSIEDENDKNPQRYSGTAIKIIKSDLDKEILPYEDNSMDVITCFEVLEHLHSDPMNLMTEVNRVLKKEGGLFFLSTPNINSFKALRRLMQLESPYFYPPYSYNDKEVGHVKEYSIKELEFLFENSGFSILDIDTFNHKEDESFSHDRHYRIGAKYSAGGKREGDAFESSLADFLKGMGWDEKLQGDYMLISGEWRQEVKDRYCFPIYETY